MNTSPPESPKRLHVVWVLGLSLLIVNAGFVLDHTVRWSNLIQGFVSSLMHAFLFGGAWFVLVLPWSVLIFYLYRWKQWGRYRTQWMLAPSLLVFLLSLSNLLLYPPTAQSRFQNVAGTDLPGELQDLHYHLSGGGFADYTEIYYFQTTPEETARLISDIQLTEDSSYGHAGMQSTPIPQLAGAPDLIYWEGANLYQGSSDDGLWFTYLVTDASQTKIYILIGSI